MIARAEDLIWSTPHLALHQRVSIQKKVVHSLPYVRTRTPKNTHSLLYYWVSFLCLFLQLRSLLPVQPKEPTCY